MMIDIEEEEEEIDTCRISEKGLGWNDFNNAQRGLWSNGLCVACRLLFCKWDCSLMCSFLNLERVILASSSKVEDEVKKDVEEDEEEERDNSSELIRSSRAFKDIVF